MGAVDGTDVRHRLHSPAPVGQLAAVQVAPQAGRAEDHQPEAQEAFRHMHFVAHDRREIGVEHVACGRTEHHTGHTQLDATVEEQPELRQETDCDDMAVTRQHRDHQHHQRGGEHTYQNERPTPSKGIGHPCADRHARHGGDGESGEHPCDELRAVRSVVTSGA